MYDKSPIRKPMHMYGFGGPSEKYMPCSTGSGVTWIPPHEGILNASDVENGYHRKEGMSPPPVAFFASTMYGNMFEMEVYVSGEVYMGTWSCAGRNVPRRVSDLGTLIWIRRERPEIVETETRVGVVVG